MSGRVSSRVWALAAATLALVPFLPGLSTARIFYTRDLSLFFWGRYLWFRRSLFGGEWPLWDPYVGAGQSAVADALHQMFFPPALATRLLAGEVLGFNLWIALACPAAAAGAWLFFARRFSRSGALLGAIAFAVSGVVVSTGNFPNLAWSVAAMPWVLWTVDRLAAAPSARRAAAVIVVVALQALAGEPVTGFTTLALSSAYALFVVSAEGEGGTMERIRIVGWVEAALVLGLLLAAVQLLPMAQAALASNRTDLRYRDFWSLHPLALLEMLSFNLFGNYFTSPDLSAAPWLSALYTGREPFFYSMYLGVPLVALAAFGLAAPGRRRWAAFWSVAGVAGLLGAFGGNTPIYPFVRDHLPVLSAFRFPVKYVVVPVMAIAAAAAAGWDALAVSGDGDPAPFTAARRAALGAAALLGSAAAATVVGCVYFTTPTAFRILAVARAIGVENPIDAAESMLHGLPGHAAQVLLLALATLALLHYGARSGGARRGARGLLFGLVVTDLLVHAWGVNPVFDAKFLAQPAWMSFVPANGDARFYVGGKFHGTLNVDDMDASRAYYGAKGLSSSGSRAALSNQAAFYPSGWRRREMLSHDLAVLWPREFATVTDRFRTATGEERDRFLERAGVRYRILPPWRSEGHHALAQVPYFLESSLYDWGEAQPRASVVGGATIVADRARALELLYEDGWDSRKTAVLDREAATAGTPGAPVEPFARIVGDRANSVALEAGAGDGGGYLVLLDSYADDWRADVDGRPAEVVRADGLFRAVKLAPGRHVVTFTYRPRAFYLGAALSATLLLVVIGLAARRERTAVS